MYYLLTAVFQAECHFSATPKLALANNVHIFPYTTYPVQQKLTSTVNVT